jgi:dTDP-4-amino-4,6-dideoxygalactose transaminase
MRAASKAAVPFFDLKAQYASIRPEIEAAMARVAESQQFILGAEVEAFEQEIAAYCACRFAIGVSSGTDALLVALMAAGVGPGAEVITSPFTFVATAGVIARLGARPVFVDIDADTFNIDPKGIAARITPQTRAIIPVHVFGRMADMESILGIARARGICVIEDAAQAIGAERHGRRAGCAGDMGCFSFYPTKNLGAFGDAGLVTTNDPELAERVRLLRSHGSGSLRNKYEYRILGGNFRLDALQAAVLRVKLRYLEQWTERRRENARRYGELLSAVSEVQLPAESPDERHVFNQFVIRAGRRDPLREHLTARGVGTDIYYPEPLHLAPCFASFGDRPGDFPASERASRECLALPIYPEMTSEMIAQVADAVSTFADP